MIRTVKTLFLPLALLSLAGCDQHHEHPHSPHTHDDSSLSVDGEFKLDTRGFNAVPLTGKAVNKQEGQFQFAIVSDRTGGHRTPIFHRAIRRLNLLQPEFVISVGDMVEGYTTDEGELSRQWTEFNAMIDELDMPYAYTPGNHDYSNDVMASIWKTRYGADFYHFIYQDVLFLVLNTEAELNHFSSPSINKAQQEYARKVLADNPDVRWTLLFMHQPIWRFGDKSNWADIEVLLKDRHYTAFAGHMHGHHHAESDTGKRDLLTLGSTGGLSMMRGQAYGEFDHVTWVTMKEDGPVIAHVDINGITNKYVTSKEFSETFRNDRSFVVSPWFSDKTGKQDGALTINIHNPHPHPLSYHIEAVANPAIMTLAMLPPGNLQPGETKQLHLPVKVVTDGLLPPLEIRAHGEVPLDEVDVATFDVTSKVVPVKRHTVARASSPINFDGEVNEWGELRFRSQPYGARRGGLETGGSIERVATDDASFAFDTAYDDNFLYVAARVTDDAVTREFNQMFAGQDAITLMLDGRPMNTSAHNRRGAETLKAGDWMLLMLVPDGKGGYQPFGDMLPKGFAATLKETETGYDAEFRIPRSYLDYKFGGAWENFRLNMSLMDEDAGEESQGTLHTGWQRDWGDGVVGTGLFFRE